MKEEKHFSILEIIFKLIGGSVYPIASQDYDDKAKERLEELLRLTASILAIIRELMNKLSGSPFASCRTIGIMCTDFLREQEMDYKFNEWINTKVENPDKNAHVEVLLKDGHIMSGYFDGNTWFVNDGGIVGVAEGHVPMYSSSCGSDDVRYWRKYQLPEGFDFEIDDYTL